MLERQKLAKQNQRTPLETVLPLKAPYVLYIDPCGMCNFNCNFCPCYRSTYRAKERHTMMDFGLFQKVVDDMAEFEDQVKVVYLYGFGEPLMNPEIIRMARYLKDKQVCREIRIYTNGTLLNPEMNQKLADSGIDLIRVSLEGLTSADYQATCVANIDFDRLVENIADLFARTRGKCEVSVKVANVSIKTEADAEKFYDIFEPISDYRFIEDIVEGWPEFEEIVLPEGSVNADEWIWRKKDRKGYTICTYSMTNMVVYANGYVGACPADWKFGTQYGDVHENSLKELWNSPKLRELQLKHLERKRHEIDVCRNCKCCGYDNVDDVADIIIQRMKEDR